MELGPGGLRERASRESKGRQGPGLGAPGNELPCGRPPQVERPPDRCFDIPNADVGTGDGTGDNLPAPLPPVTNSYRSREGGRWEGWAGLPGELSPPLSL